MGGFPGAEIDTDRAEACRTGFLWSIAKNIGLPGYLETDKACRYHAGL
jgi:hypothetical protein